MFQIPIPILMQHGEGLERALSILRIYRSSDAVEAPVNQRLLNSLTPFTDLIPETDQRRVEELIQQGSGREAFRILAHHEPGIRRLQDRYLSESALQKARMTLERAKERPWKNERLSLSLRRNFELFRDIAVRALQAESFSPDLRDDLYGRYNNAEVAVPRSEAEAMHYIRQASESIISGSWLHGGDIGDFRVHGRIYLSLRADQCDDLWRYLKRTLEPAVREQGAVVEYKMHMQPKIVSRFDIAVIYFAADHERTVYDAVVKMHRALPQAFKPGVPAFAMPLADTEGSPMTGVSFGQNPRTHESFGRRRCDVLARSIHIARLLAQEGQAVDWEELCRMFAGFMKWAGIDTDNPAFDKDAHYSLHFFSQLPLKPASADDPDFARELIAIELRERYPALSAAPYGDWVEKMAADIYGAWERSDRAPAGPRASLYVPEELLEERLSRFSDAAFLSAIRSGDQGSRWKRAIDASIHRGFYSLRDPSLASVARMLVDNLHKAWKAQNPAAGEVATLWEEVFRGRLKWMRDYLENQATPLNKPLESLLVEIRCALESPFFLSSDF